MGLAKNEARMLNFRKANFQLFNESIGPPGKLLSGAREQNRAGRSLRILSIECKSSQSPGVEKSGKQGKRPTWMSQDLLVNLKGKREMHRQWKQGQVSWEKYGDPAQLSRDDVRKAKAQLELNLARDTKNNKKHVYRYVSQKRKVKESITLLMNKTSNKRRG